MNKYSGVLAFLLFIQLLGFSRPAQCQQVSQPSSLNGGADTTASVPEKYRFLYSGSLDPPKTADHWRSLPFSSIELERTECFGECPSYVVRLNSDGTVSYNGKAHVAQIGAFSGKIDIWSYGRICHAIERLKILDGKRKYSANWTDDATTILRLKLQGKNESIEISDYGSQGPVELWTIFNAIDGVTARIKLSNEKKENAE